MEPKKELSRVTADLPPLEFDLLKAARVRDGKVSTSDVVRALLRLQSQDPDLAERMSEEIQQIAIEKAQADLEAKRLKRRRNSPQRRALVA